ncbi:siderophore ABC transporter substrate-binding protein [Paenibacillus tarimensis]|uniref:siderophore ABC transporter substrate-binding protein n=1 Tax=Paenibacillus tarimensis TaxID=416012 RepID=UPI001F1EC21A|nr:siderophore ABC transporter substrate-binding protein [Paenibacillus tarimensis]MCF2943481.1 siderophore ABC transporter substrate-binding protein [Paenibacillus tarimensis]
MSKKFSVLILTIIMAVLVAACGAGNSNNTNTAPANSTAGAAAENTASNAPADEAAQPAETEELTITHQYGDTKVKKNPKKVVVFDFGVLDSLDKLGVEVTGVPQANIPPYLEKYADAKYENVGSLKEPDFERISAIQPDLIIISGRQGEAYEELSKLGSTIFMGVDANRYMESFEENMKTLGEIFGKEAEVEQELAAVEQAVADLKAKAEASGKKALIILAQDGNISAYGPGSRFGIIHDVFGFEAVDPEIKVDTHGQSISSEYIVEKNPDYLFVIDRAAAVGGESSAKQTVENELVKTTKAAQEGHIFYLNPNYWYLSGGGLISVSEMVKEIAATLE